MNEGNKETNYYGFTALKHLQLYFVEIPIVVMLCVCLDRVTASLLLAWSGCS